MNFIGYSAIPHTLVRSDGRHISQEQGPHTPQDYLEFCLEGHGPETIHGCYDLDAFAAVLFKAIGLTKEDAKTLTHGTNKKLFLRYPDAPLYSLTYIPSKYLAISRGTGWGNPYAAYYDIGQYFDGPNLLTTDLGTAIMQATNTRDIAQEVSGILYDLGLDPKALTSPARALEKTVLSRMKLPNHTDAPPEVNNMALASCHGGWTEAFALGHYDAYDLDMTAAYASILAELIDYRRGDWFTYDSTKGDKPIPPEAFTYGLGWAKVTPIITSEFSPVQYGTTDLERNTTPIGKFPEPITTTLPTLAHIDRYKLGAYDIHYAEYWLPNGPTFQPLKGEINWLFKKRIGTTGRKRNVVKRGLAGTYGKLLSDKGKDYSDLYNPPWGSLVENICALKVDAFIRDHKLPRLFIATDGFLTTVDPHLPDKDSDHLGDWRVSHVGKALIVNSGVAAVQGKYNSEAFSLNYDWLMGEIENDPKASAYTMRKLSCINLLRALESDFSKLGTFEETTRSIIIGQEAKRLYPRMPKCGLDLITKHYPSLPMQAGLIHTLNLGKQLEKESK